jgi:antitoxin component of MazEF toxin-antitoxin module
MTEQKLMVTGLYRPGWHRWPDLGQVPYLPLAGNWLAEAGFPAGARVAVEVVGDGELVVRRVEEVASIEAHREATDLPRAHETREREPEAVHA